MGPQFALLYALHSVGCRALWANDAVVGCGDMALEMVRKQ